jgi:hypothetical protein
MNLQQIMFPNVPQKLLRSINHSLDNPTIAQKKLTSSYSPVINGVRINPFDAFGLGKRSAHRNWNHDFFMAMMLGFQQGGAQGARIALAHLIQDFQADMMKKRHGTRNRDAWEAQFNYYFALHR